MPNNKNRKKKSPEERIAGKYAMRTPESIREHERKVEQTKSKYSMDSAETEKNLTEYLEIKDPIVAGGKAIMWCKRPSMKQLKEMIPKEMRPYVDNPAEVPEEMNQRYEKHFYEKMAELIAIPKKSAKDWEEISNPWFVRLFWNHIANIAQLLEGRIEGF